MKRFENMLLCSDLDGTLLQSDQTISAQTLEAIEYFKSEGGLFTFITGRMPYFVSSIEQTVHPNAPIGCINGGGLYDFRTQAYLWRLEISRDVLELVRDVEREIPGIGIQVNTFNTLFFCTENEGMKEFRRFTGLPNITCHYNDVNEPIAKIVFCDHIEEHITAAQALLASHPRAHEFTFIRSEKTLYEILPKGIHKGVALRTLAEHYHIPRENTIAVGDYDNDIGMLRQAGIGVAVANATAATKAAADHITVSNNEHPIAKIIEGLENGTLHA